MEKSEWVGTIGATAEKRRCKPVLRRLLFETTVGDWMLRVFENVTGFGLVELEVLESWRYGVEKPTPARQR